MGHFKVPKSCDQLLFGLAYGPQTTIDHRARGAVRGKVLGDGDKEKNYFFKHAVILTLW